MFMKDQFCLLKNSNSEQNVCESAENTKVIELLQQQNQNLIQENASKNTIIKILAEKHTFDNSNSKSAVSEDFTTVNRKKSSRPRKHKKVDLNCSNRYETLYITDSNTDSERDDSDDITITDTPTDNNREPGHTHRSHQRNVNRGNDTRVRNAKQRPQPQPQDYNNFSQENLNPHQKAKDFRELKKKPNSILIFTDSMLKTLRMGEFNQFLQEGKAYLKPFPGAKAKQLNHHATVVLAQHQYDSAIIHVGINDLLNGSSIKQISKDVIEIAQQCRNRSIGKVFVSGIVYCTKVRYETTQNLNKSLYEECRKYGFCFIDNGAVSEKDLWKDGIHLIESGRVIVANNLINYLNNFLRPVNHPIWGQI